MPGKGWVRSLFQRPEMVDHLEKEFKRADTSRDGKLQVGELHKALMVVVWQLKQAGMFHESMTVTYEQTMEIFRNFDKNGDGTVDFLEFKDIAAQLLTRPFQDERSVKAFCRSVVNSMTAKRKGDGGEELDSLIGTMFKEVGGSMDQHTLAAILRELHLGFQAQGFIDPQALFHVKEVPVILAKFDEDGSGVIEEPEFTPLLEEFLFRTFYIR